MKTLVLLGILALCAGCGGSSDDGGVASGGSAGSGASGGTSATGGTGGTGASGGTGATGGSGGAPAEWTTLIEGNWDVPSGEERYWCSTKTLTQDVYIKAFRAEAPIGTHHTLLLYGDGGPDTQYPCSATLQDSMVFASGLGSDDLVFPDGVALKIPAGTQLLLNLHLFNTGSGTLSGVSGTQVQTVSAAEVQQEAELILPGTMQILIPPNSSPTFSGDCQFPGAATISTVWPHMHKYGSHMKVVHQSAAGDSVLHDGAYSFNEQKNYPLVPPVAIAAGDVIRVECTYTNPTSQTIIFGDSTNSEMCFAGIYRYPKLSHSCQ